MNEKYMKIALNEAKKAAKNDEVPVGAVIIQNNKIISKAYNKKEKSKNIIKHAEIIAIEKANKKNKSWHLDDCIIYVTLEPCMMCMGAIIESHIKKIVYGCNSKKYGVVEFINQLPKKIKNNYKIEIQSGILHDECKQILQTFFQNKRKK